MEINFSINGLQELDTALKQLPDKFARKAGEAGVRAAGNVLKKAIKEKAPEHLKDTIVVKKDKAGPAGINYIVGSKSSLAHFPEFGTTAHKIVAGFKRGEKTGKVVLSNGKIIFGKEIMHPGEKAEPFFRPAIDESMPQALDKMREVMARSINNQATKFVEE